MHQNSALHQAPGGTLEQRYWELHDKHFTRLTAPRRRGPMPSSFSFEREWEEASRLARAQLRERPRVAVPSRGSERGHRSRESHGNRPGQRRSRRTSSRSPDDSDPAPGEPPLERHPRWGLVSPNLLRLLEQVTR